MNFFKPAAIICTALAMTACNQQSSTKTYEMTVKEAYARLKDKAILTPLKTEQFSEAGKHVIVDKRTDEYVTYAYVYGGEQYWYTASLEKVDEDTTGIKLEFFPNAHLKDLPAASINMLYAASAERVMAHMEGREPDGRKIQMKSTGYILMNPVETHTDIARMRNEAIAAAKKDGIKVE